MRTPDSFRAVDDYHRHATEYLTGERLDPPRLPTPPEGTPLGRAEVVDLEAYRRERARRKSEGQP